MLFETFPERIVLVDHKRQPDNNRRKGERRKNWSLRNHLNRPLHKQWVQYQTHLRNGGIRETWGFCLMFREYKR